MTYGQFLALFLGIPLVALVIGARAALTPRLVVIFAAVATIALLYTGPWDNLIIINGVWSYGPGHVLGIVIGHVPLEEYAFYILQVILTGTLTALLLRRAAR